MATIAQRSAALMVIVALSAPAPGNADDWSQFRSHTRYDHIFNKYTKRFFGPAFRWQHFKAQAIAESGLQADARSQVGAQGVMQIMPATWSEIRRRSTVVSGSATDPRWNIAGGIWYNRQLFRTWVDDRTLRERLRFTFGSYNAGKGNILKAQRHATALRLNPIQWQSIEQALPTVTGSHSRETITYVQKIEAIFRDL